VLLYLALKGYSCQLLLTLCIFSIAELLENSRKFIFDLLYQADIRPLFLTLHPRASA
jgi:hypothetical protein